MTTLGLDLPDQASLLSFSIMDALLMAYPRLPFFYYNCSFKNRSYVHLCRRYKDSQVAIVIVKL